ncbi:helix-turn-helix transcriptional regulator [Candidatus Parcubacteria bacterium]|nr:helix-turn-helix transcriptional regulator [Candidatus Parcubacteria bacterium]
MKERRKENQDDKKFKKLIGSSIKKIRIGRGLTARRLAEKIKISRSSLVQIENGNNNINAVLMWKIACRLGCGIKEFFPTVAEGFALSKNDIDNIKKMDKKGADFAIKCFGKEQ